MHGKRERHRWRYVGVALATLASLAGCASKDAPPPPSANPTPTPTQDASSDAIAPGKGFAAITLGMRYAEVKGLLGETAGVGFNRLLFARYPAKGLELVFASAIDGAISDDAIVVAIGVQPAADAHGTPRAGQKRSEIEASLGKAPDVTGAFDYYPAGVSIQYDAPSSPDAIAKAVGIYARYTPESTAQEMQPAKTNGHATPMTIDASKIHVVDLHLHPGLFGRIPSATKTFIVGSTPVFTQLYAPGVLAAAVDPYAPFLGIKAQTELAAVDHAVLFAVYTQHTTGFFSNEDLEAVLTDPRNVAPDGLPWAWGLASINFFDGYVDGKGSVVTSVASARLSALASYFANRRDLFIGIKLAHAHQSVAFDDARYLGVYDVAKRAKVPVYLHTGFSPFPNAANQPAYYDPQGLENTILNTPDVSFILGHVGQGDARAVEHALGLAKKYPNVYLEISALNRPLLVDPDGHDVPADPKAPQYPYVLEQIKTRGLVSKTIFGSDGPQFSGMVKGYVALMTTTMSDKGYTPDEIQKVMSGNFARVFFPTP
jgi:hypothetical protein